MPRFRARQALWEIKGKIAKLPGLYPAFRWATERLGENRVYPLLWGPMRGFRWRRYNGVSYWYHLGLYEPHVSALLLSHLRPGDMFWDVGANAGYHALLASRVVGESGRVVAFEPDPAAVEILRDEFALNDMHCDVEQVALSDRAGTAVLRRHENCLMSALDGVPDGPTGEPLDVEASTLDAMAERYGPPQVIKMDIEGGERFALPGGDGLLSGPDRPRLLLSVHGSEVEAFCVEFLEARDYQIESQTGFEQMLIAVPRP